jgi:hypothetical protein
MTHVHKEHLELLERFGCNARRDRRPGDRGHGCDTGGEALKKR